MYRIAWLPGDGIGPEVCDAARTGPGRGRIRGRIHSRRHRLGVLAQGGRGPARAHRRAVALHRLRVLRRHHVEARQRRGARTAAHLQGQGAELLQPHRPHAPDAGPVRLPAALPGVPGNPLNYRDDIDLVVFRENTEGMYIGVEFARVPESFRPVPGMDRIPLDAAISIRSVTRHASTASCERPSNTP
jgi:hypothetical protein